jgi:hypothetical protein
LTVSQFEKAVGIKLILQVVGLDVGLFDGVELGTGVGIKLALEVGFDVGKELEIILKSKKIKVVAKCIEFC